MMKIIRNERTKHFLEILGFQENTGLQYDAYLRQVVEVLESDDDFRQKLETANVSDIKVRLFVQVCFFFFHKSDKLKFISVAFKYL